MLSLDVWECILQRCGLGALPRLGAAWRACGKRVLLPLLLRRLTQVLRAAPNDKVLACKSLGFRAPHAEVRWRSARMQRAMKYNMFSGLFNGWAMMTWWDEWIAGINMLQSRPCDTRATMCDPAVTLQLMPQLILHRYLYMCEHSFSWAPATCTLQGFLDTLVTSPYFYPHAGRLALDPFVQAWEQHFKTSSTESLVFRLHVTQDMDDICWFELQGVAICGGDCSR